MEQETKKAETPSASRTAAQLDLARVVKGLEDGLREVGRAMAASAQRGKEAREVGALFDLHRQLRAVDSLPDMPMPADARELQALMLASLHGYGQEYLSQLVKFGEWLSEHALKEWRTHV